MTRQRDKLINFIYKYIGTVRFGNDHFAAIMGHGDLQIGNILISRVYYVKGPGHNLFSVGQFCDSNLEVALRKHTSFVQNLDGVDLLLGSQEAVATTCYTQNRSLIHTRYNKTPYELLRNRKLDLKFLYIFGALCYPTNDSEDLGKLKPKADIGIFFDYPPSKKDYRIYHKRTRMIMETIHVQFDELTQIASE
ncbi:retrovirus-related pol polyprotein from transposon TNT 1-94 [Tanacetum coccineum]